MTLLGDAADLVALVYHEARNVRHLVRAKAVDAEDWKYLVALPTNRNDAWAVLQEIRRSARLEARVSGVLHRFEQRFHVNLEQLEVLYGHAGWRNSSCGGNAWLAVTKLVRRFVECIDQGLGAEAIEVRDSLQTARHNTGTVAEKLRRLDEALSARPAG